MLRKIITSFAVAAALTVGIIIGRVFIPGGLAAAGQPVTSPKNTSDESYFEIMRTQQEDWGTFVIYADRETRNGFLISYDHNGTAIGMQALVNAVGEPQRYGWKDDISADGGANSNSVLLDRLLPEQHKIEVPSIYGRKDSIPFMLEGKIADVTYVLASYGNQSSVGLDYTQIDNFTENTEKRKSSGGPDELETLVVAGKTYCTACDPPCEHECLREINRKVAEAVTELRNCYHCDSISIVGRVVLKTETDPYTEWEVPRLWYGANYAPDAADDGQKDSKEVEITYQPGKDRWIEIETEEESQETETGGE